MNPKRMLIVSSEFPPQPGGIGNHAYNLASYLHQADFDVTVLVDSRSPSGQVEADFDAGLPFKVERIPVNNFRPLMYFRRISRFAKLRRKHDCIIASGKFSLWLVGFGRLFNSYPCMAIIHGTEVNFKSVLLKWSIGKALKQFDGVVAVSNYTKTKVAHLNLKRITVIPNGYDPAVWEIRSQTKVVGQGYPKLITVGRVSERKGQLQVIRHLVKGVEIYPNLHYHCVGLPGDTSAYIQVAHELGVDQHITFHGPLEHDALIDLVSQCDIKVMLSTETKTGDVEGFGIAIIEANALGIPAIGALGSGVEEAIAPGESGILIQGHDAKAFVDAVSTIMNNQEAFKNSALQWAEQHRWDRIVKTYIRVIKSVV